MTNFQCPMSNEGIIKKIFKHPVTILFLLSVILFFFKLGSFSLYDAAETTYGEFVKNILNSGDWITLHYNGQIIFDKPPLYFWLAAILSKVIGFSEFSMRFWAALAGILTVITTYFLGKTLYNERTGFLSAIIVMTAFQFLVQSRIAELDVVLTLFLLLILFLFLSGYKSNNRTFYLLAYIPMGFALLIKGLIGAALPLCTILLFLLFKKELPKIREMFPILGILVALLIGLPWYITEYLIHGKVFLDFALGFLFLSRFQGVVSGHNGPWYYYFIAIILGFAPWSHFLILSLRQTWEKKHNNGELLILCFTIPAFIVFSVAKTKIPNYVLPLYPFLALSVGKLWDDFLGEKQTELKRGMSDANILLAAVVLLIIIGFIIAGNANYQMEYKSAIPLLLLLAGILIIGSFSSIILYFQKQYLFSFAALPAMVFIIMFSLTIFVLPQVEIFKGTKELCSEVAKAIKPDETITAFDIGNRPGVVFYNKKPITFLKSEGEMIKFLAEKRGYCFTTKEEYGKVKDRVKLFKSMGELAVVY